jgi:hypothetical protein
MALVAKCNRPSSVGETTKTNSEASNSKTNSLHAHFTKKIQYKMPLHENKNVKYIYMYRYMYLYLIKAHKTGSNLMFKRWQPKPILEIPKSRSTRNVTLS